MYICIRYITLFHYVTKAFRLPIFLFLNDIMWFNYLCFLAVFRVEINRIMLLKLPILQKQVSHLKEGGNMKGPKEMKEIASKEDMKTKVIKKTIMRPELISGIKLKVQKQLVHQINSAIGMTSCLMLLHQKLTGIK